MSDNSQIGVPKSRQNWQGLSRLDSSSCSSACSQAGASLAFQSYRTFPGRRLRLRMMLSAWPARSYAGSPCSWWTALPGAASCGVEQTQEVNFPRARGTSLLDSPLWTDSALWAY